MPIRVGFIIASNRVMLEGQPVGYFYREEPDNGQDSGWRVFSGEETQEYVNDPANFALYSMASVLEVQPSLVAFLGCEYPVAFELDPVSGEFVDITDEFAWNEEDDSGASS